MRAQKLWRIGLVALHPIGDAADPQDDDVEEIGDQDDSPSDDTVEGTPPSQEDGKSPTTTLRVQEAILKELGSEEVRKVNCYGQEVSLARTGPPAHFRTSQTYSGAWGGPASLEASPITLRA